MKLDFDLQVDGTPESFLVPFFIRMLEGLTSQLGNDAYKEWTKKELDPDSPGVASMLQPFLEFGDEVWYVQSPPATWAQLAGRSGLVIVRDQIPIYVRWLCIG